ncbi:hypothetical protein MPER_10697 [Moniliophthora perniciosa FA553]|nr:hypothetical protein MPER_10697 [Moniliophthora perniciosa FA553]
MAPSESEDDLFDDVEDEDEEPEREIEEELPIDVAVDDATEGDDEDLSEDSEDDTNDDDDDDGGNEISNEQLVAELQVEMAKQISRASSSESQSQQSKESKDSSSCPTPSNFELLRRHLSAADVHPLLPAKNLRLKAVPRTFIVEAICALPHPVPTHSLAASQCMTHLLTGSDDGYIRDYDIFTALNSKNFLSAPQRHHSGVVEGIMKAGQIRFWWENPALPPVGMEAERPLAPVYSLAVHSDLLWALAGTDTGPINLFTVRHEPGRLCHTLTGHRGPVSAMSMDHDEQGFLSAGWGEEAIVNVLCG